MPQYLLDPFDPPSEEDRFPIGHGTVSSGEGFLFMARYRGGSRRRKGRKSGVSWVSPPLSARYGGRKPRFSRPGQLFDGETASLHEEWVVLLIGDRIVAVGPESAVEAPAGTRKPGPTGPPGPPPLPVLSSDQLD